MSVCKPQCKGEIAVLLDRTIPVSQVLGIDDSYLTEITLREISVTHRQVSENSLSGSERGDEGPQRIAAGVTKRSSTMSAHRSFSFAHSDRNASV
jgi:hypothetical protein